MTGTYATPRVCIDEINAFPNAVVAVATAVPAFIGYLPRADYEESRTTTKRRRSRRSRSSRRSTCFQIRRLRRIPQNNIAPQYLVAQKEQLTIGHYMSIAGQYYSILPDPSTIYYL